MSEFSGDTKTLVVSPSKVVIPDQYKPVFTMYSEWIDKNINPKNCQGITITFKPTFQLMDPCYLKSWIKKIFKNILKDSEKQSKLILLYEISPMGMFHYHGIMSDFSYTKIAEVRRTLSKYVGRTEIKQIKYYDSYKQYILKRYIQESENYENIRSKYDIQLIRNDKSYIQVMVDQFNKKTLEQFI